MLRFMDSADLEQKGLAIERDNYTAVYAGELKPAGDTQDKLNELCQTFNTDHPEDFRGHSLSVSDIVALRQDGAVSCHYVDSRGFKELPGFFQPENYLKNAEMTITTGLPQGQGLCGERRNDGMSELSASAGSEGYEVRDDEIDGIVSNGPKQTSAEIEADAMAGKPVSLLSYVEAVRREQQEQKEAPRPEKKPSVLAKLQAPLSEPKKSTFKKCGKGDVMMDFTNDELNLMCIYQRDTRKELIAALTEMRGYLDADETELRELTDSAIGKLEKTTDEQFAELELVPNFDPDADE